jgi:hypothetical protein
MTAAIFGLIGVIIGGLLNGAVTYLAHRQQQKAASKIAARVVLSEIKGNERAIRITLRFENWANAKLALTVDQWLAHRETLAGSLRDQEWVAVETYYGATDRMIVATELAKTRDDLDDDETRVLKLLNTHGEAAAMALRRLAGS